MQHVNNYHDIRCCIRVKEKKKIKHEFNLYKIGYLVN